MSSTATAIDPQVHLARLLDSSRIAAGVSQESLAKTIGVSPKRVQEILDGKHDIEMGQLRRIGGTLGIDYRDWLQEIA
jgi:plasmid maintenance system antidote protein VapI